MISASRSCCLAFRTLCVTPARSQLSREILGDLDRDRADQDRLAALVALLDVSRPPPELAVLVLEDVVVVVVADHRLVGRDLDHSGLVDLHELLRLGQRRAGHAGELFVEAEVVLQGDRRQGLVLLADAHPLLGLDRLVQAPPTSAGPRGCGR